MEKLLLTETEAAQYLGVSTQFLQQQRNKENQEKTPSGPSFLQFGDSTRYSIKDLNIWRTQQKNITHKK